MHRDGFDLIKVAADQLLRWKLILDEQDADVALNDLIEQTGRVARGDVNHIEREAEFQLLALALRVDEVGAREGPGLGRTAIESEIFARLQKGRSLVIVAGPES